MADEVLDCVHSDCGFEDALVKGEKKAFLLVVQLLQSIIPISM